MAMHGNLVETFRLWDAVMLASADRPLPAVVLERGSVLRPPAESAAIRAAEERLGMALPPSYVAFLSYSDGAYANGCGLVSEAGASGLLPAAGISWLADTAPDHVALWVETFGDVPLDLREARADGQDVVSFAPFADAVLITPMVDAICDCLVPVGPDVDAGGEGFEVWETFKDGATRFLTFAHWLERMIATQWVARHDADVRRLTPALAAQLASIERWRADPDFAWYAIRLVRELAAVPIDHRVLETLDRLEDGDDPYLRLAAAQAGLVHRPDRARRRLAALTASAEPTVALAAAATLRASDHPAVSDLPRSDQES